MAIFIPDKLYISERCSAPRIIVEKNVSIFEVQRTEI